MAKVRHLWLDFSDTIARINRAEVENIVYAAYADLVGKPVTPELKVEYQSLVKQYKSNSAVFAALGMPSSYAAELASRVAPAEKWGQPPFPHVKLNSCLASNVSISAVMYITS